jgi:branched-chain amino acid transport system substrate-binding protein
MANMKATPINDFYNTNVKVREDGCVMHEMHLWRVKPASESKYKYDFCTQVAAIAPAEAWRPLKDGGCPYIKA